MTEKKRLEIACEMIKEAEGKTDKKIEAFWIAHYSHASKRELDKIQREITESRAAAEAIYKLLDAIDLLPDEYIIPF